MSLSVVCRQSSIFKTIIVVVLSVVDFFKISTLRLTYLHMGDSKLVKEENLSSDRERRENNK
jgi:hypothetical protein